MIGSCLNPNAPSSILASTLKSLTSEIRFLLLARTDPLQTYEVPEKQGEKWFYVYKDGTQESKLTNVNIKHILWYNFKKLISDNLGTCLASKERARLPMDTRPLAHHLNGMSWSLGVAGGTSHATQSLSL